MKMQIVPAYIRYTRSFNLIFGTEAVMIGIRNFLCVSGIECLVPHLIDKTNLETGFRLVAVRACMRACDFSLYVEHTGLPFFCMLGHNLCKAFVNSELLGGSPGIAVKHLSSVTQAFPS